MNWNANGVGASRFGVQRVHETRLCAHVSSLLMSDLVKCGKTTKKRRPRKRVVRERLCCSPRFYDEGCCYEQPLPFTEIPMSRTRTDEHTSLTHE